MTERGQNRGTSPYDSILDDDYSDDFDDDNGTDGGNKRYKTRSPLNRTDTEVDDFFDTDWEQVLPGANKRAAVQNPSDTVDDFIDVERPQALPGANTNRKARGGMSLASGYLTPNSRKLNNLTPMSKLSLKSATYTESAYLTPRTQSTQSKSPNKKVFYRSNRGRGRGRGRFSQLGNQDSSRIDNITKRVLSARRLKINEIQNQNQELLIQIKDLKEENKLLKRTQHRANKALEKFEDRESELPQLIQRQNNETRSLRDQIRKWREKYEKTDRYLRDAEDELEKVKVKLKKLKSLADEKDLPERAELNKKLNNAELEIEAKDVKVRELERHIQNLEKNHRHELGIERARYKDAQKQLDQIREDNDKLNVTVKEKEKEIQMKNIYANRAVKPPHRLPNSYNGTPHGTPPPQRRRQSLSEADKMTPRDRAKQMEEKRREELRKQRELKQHKVRLFAGSADNDEQHDKIKREKELRKMQEEREKEDAERREEEEKERREYEEREREMNAQAEREAEDRRMREERERMKREAEERDRREREKKEREERERKQKEKREKEERERRERERLEQERRAAEERKRFEDDVTIQAERKKKDEILAKLREIDEGGAGKKKEKENLGDPFFVTQTKEDSEDSMASKKSYTFSKPTENLHKGKPAHKDTNSNTGFSVGKGPTQGRRNRDIDDLELGGYNPTFGSSKAGASSTAATKTFSLFDDNDSKTTSVAPKEAQKSKLLDELFGSKDDAPKQNDLFAPKPPASKKPNQSKGVFPWDEDGPTNRKQSGTMNTKRENSATLFGGGSALVNDEDLHKSQVRSNASVPRRQKHTTTFHTRPTVNAVDHFDDEIEEVIL